MSFFIALLRLTKCDGNYGLGTSTMSPRSSFRSDAFCLRSGRMGMLIFLPFLKIVIEPIGLTNELAPPACPIAPSKVSPGFHTRRWGTRTPPLMTTKFFCAASATVGSLSAFVIAGHEITSSAGLSFRRVTCIAQRRTICGNINGKSFKEAEEHEFLSSFSC